MIVKTGSSDGYGQNRNEPIRYFDQNCGRLPMLFELGLHRKRVLVTAGTKESARLSSRSFANLTPEF